MVGADFESHGVGSFDVLIIGAVRGDARSRGTLGRSSHTHGIVTETIPTLRIGLRPVNQHETQIMIRGTMVELYQPKGCLGLVVLLTKHGDQ